MMNDDNKEMVINNVTIKQKFVSTNKYNIKCPYEMKAEGICVHNTSNDASAENEIAYMISNNNYTSYHYAIDDKDIIQAIPENRSAFHAGDGVDGKGNRNYIGVEICYSKSGGERFIKAEKNAAVFIAQKLKEYGWDISNVKKHQDFSGKYCPHRTLDMGWQRFLDMIQNELDEPGKEKKNMLNPYDGGKFRVTSIYGMRGNEFHSGLDIVGESSKNLVALCDGTIIQSRIVAKSTGDLTWQWGNYVCLQADTGERIFYCHLSKRLVSKGQRVRKGDVVGIEGSTGYSFGSHCHLEIRSAENKVTSSVNTVKFTGIPNKVGTYIVENEEDKPMTAAERIEFNKLVEEVNELKKLNKVYHYWDEIKKLGGDQYDALYALYKAKYFCGKSASDLNISKDKLETLVVMARALRADGKLNF